MSRTLRRLAALAFIVATTAVACGDNPFTGTVTEPPAPLAFGMGVHGTPAPLIAQLRATGIRWVRLTYYYQTVGDTAWERMLARDLDTLRDNGLSIDLVVHSTPWNDPDGVGIPHAVAELIRQHPGAIDAVELYNEENVGVDYWRPVLPGASDYERGRAYASRYQAMRDTIEALLPLMRMPVVTGGTAGSPREFLRGIREAGVTPDIVAVHAYGWPPYLQLDDVVREAREIFPRVPVWATEVGSEGGRTDPTTLTLDIAGTFTWMRLHPEVRVFWYVAWGDQESSVWDQDTFAPRPGNEQIVTGGPYR